MLKLDRFENEFLKRYPDRIVTIDSHTQGEPTRLLISGVGTLPGITMKDKRDYSVDLVCVGGYFAMVSARSIGIDLVPENSHRLIPLGMAVIEAANRAHSVYHPERPEVNTVDVTEFYDEDPKTGTGMSVVIYGESHMDRSPCGTGTTAKMTLLHNRGKFCSGQVYKSAGPLGTVFEGRIVKTLSIGKFDGIVGQVRGNAQITGYHQFVVDANDPFQKGFLI